MKNVVLYSLFFVVIASVGCKNNNPQQVATITDTTSFFSTRDFFSNEIKQVQSTPYFMYKIVTGADGKKDSVVCSVDVFTALAQQFTACDIAEKGVKENYKESVFKDNSTKSITLNYTALNKALPVQNIDVLLNDETNKVKRVFIRKAEDKQDSLVTTNYSWKAGKSFMINKSVEKNDGTKYTVQTLVDWNDKDK